ncbi:MAG TPA: hypothetical protein VE961_08665 [Pyrinomonadaceae bacterium]|nr:hypothetical protein [Pyrinomonadaceae bacterium]
MFREQKGRQTFSRTAGLFLLTLFLFHPGVLAQTNEKMIIRRLTLMKYPLDFTVEYQGKPVTGDWKTYPDLGVRRQLFAGESDWLRDVSFKVKNISDETITYVSLVLVFPQTANEAAENGPRLSSPAPQRPRGSVLHSISIGMDPFGKLADHELRLRPGEELEIPIRPDYNDIRKLIGSMDYPIEQVTQMEVRVQSVRLGEDRFFNAGRMYRRDPKEPHRWIPIEAAPSDRKP